MVLGFIGCSDLTKAMMRGILQDGGVKADHIIVTDCDKYELLKLQEEAGVRTALTRAEVARHSDLIFLAEDAEFYPGIAAEIAHLLSGDQVLISIAPNMTIDDVATLFGPKVKIIRAKPNMPAIVGESMTGICAGDLVTHEDFNTVCNLMRSFGVVEQVPEKLIDVVIAVSSSSPAYVFMFIEAMADAASADGMPRAQAYEFAAQAVLGSAKMILETGKHPGELKDMVCSPGGTTLEALRVLENHGLRSSVFEAVKACASKCKPVKLSPRKGGRRGIPVRVTVKKN